MYNVKHFLDIKKQMNTDLTSVFDEIKHQTQAADELTHWIEYVGKKY